MLTLEMSNSSAKNLMSLAENLLSVWSFFPLKLSTSPMPRTSHLCVSFSRLAFFWLSKTFQVLLFHSHAHALYLLFSFWRISWVSLSNWTYFRLQKPHPGTLCVVSLMSSAYHLWALMCIFEQMKQNLHLTLTFAQTKGLWPVNINSKHDLRIFLEFFF